ncbi:MULTISPECIES: GTP pyrophosphokinase [Winogradskyella]|uniref:GTP pyrophosphokinase n=1 Tax=Winogradskyella TaxID=286104 RepID=UPI00399B4789
MELDKNAIYRTYEKKQPLFKRALSNTKDALQQFLAEKEIPYLVISTRVKDFSSFFEKISRKKYENPFEENEDFCGVRIIVYHLEDIDKVRDILKEHYDVQNLEDKTDSLELNQFGYRSKHLIIKIRNSWCVTPNYKNLNNIKIEVQIRTVLMHAWAEIEHKLGYKSKNQIPGKLQRKLFLMSAKLEDADHQFQDIKNEADEYKYKTISESEKAGKFVGNDLNLNSLQALLTYYFPNEEPHSEMESRLLQEIEKSELSMKDLVSTAEKSVKAVEFIKENMFNGDIIRTTPRANILTYGLEAFNNNFRKIAPSSNSRSQIVEKLKRKYS